MVGTGIATERRRRFFSNASGALTLVAGVVAATGASPASAASRQSLDDAWWTGPILAASAATLPQGHFLIEPYFYDVITHGRYGENGDRNGAARTNGFGSQTYLLFGLTDRLTVGLIPRFGFNEIGHGEDSSGIGLGDLTFHAHYRLTEFREGGRLPTTSLVLEETFPTGKYDRLGARPSDGLGSGAFTTTVALYSQYYFWLPNGRIVRTRLNLSHSFSDDVTIEDVSVYGTRSGFRGHARPGNTFTVNSSFEYSLTRSWVFALDVLYQHDRNTHVNGNGIELIEGSPQRVDVLRDSGSGWRLGFVPAIEYSWSSTAGVIVGARWIAAGRNADATITPVVAINLVY